jgi:lysophospholipase L1-like esterase
MAGPLRRAAARAVVVVSAALALTQVVAPAAQAAGCTHDAHLDGISRVRARTQTAQVVVYGDSITAQAWHLLPSSWGYDAHWGRRTSEAVSVLLADLRARSAPPRVVIMAIGTNDIRGPRVVEPLVRLTRRVLPRSTRLIWVNTFITPNPRWARVNRSISDVTGVEVADWARMNTAMGHARGSLLLDRTGVHTNCRGAHARVTLLRNAVART